MNDPVVMFVSIAVAVLYFINHALWSGLKGRPLHYTLLWINLANWTLMTWLFIAVWSAIPFAAIWSGWEVKNALLMFWWKMHERKVKV